MLFKKCVTHTLKLGKGCRLTWKGLKGGVHGKGV